MVRMCRLPGVIACALVAGASAWAGMTPEEIKRWGDVEYACWYVFDSSAAKMIRAYLAMYRAEGQEIDLMKASALADTMTRIQQENGRIPTPFG